MQTIEEDIEINEGFKNALHVMEKTVCTAFITGKAGTGKSTLLQHFRKNTKKNVVVLAPTGVAALNVKGQTIHSFFKFPLHITPQTVRRKKPAKKLCELIKRLDTIVIDEVSMVRADMMDCIDEMLRFILDTSEPFGGIQMIFIGDLYQLPPVVAGDEAKELFRTHYKSAYFFDAHVFDEVHMGMIELTKIYRQKDPLFIELLNRIRNNKVGDQEIEYLNSRYQPKYRSLASNEFCITLTTTNASANTINEHELSKLSTKSNTLHGKVYGEFKTSHLPTTERLNVKVGAQIMMLNNDSEGRWVNGSIGKITGIEWDEYAEDDVLIVKLSEGKTVRVEKHKWEIYKYSYNQESAQLEATVIGSFTQYPLRLAWAVTIHKSQGKTFDKVIVDIGRGTFSHGQVYVAISRCTSFEGLILKTPILKKHIWMDFNINRFLRRSA